MESIFEPLERELKQLTYELKEISEDHERYNHYFEIARERKQHQIDELKVYIKLRKQEIEQQGAQ